ncbi:MAG: hypothetical protein SFV51_07130 [Bryobacteraceae bacterium]|nr:hypothetical protein [Bryobacteraceae bacterium]
MFPGFAITAFSFLLLVYWFRYTCLLILNTRPAKDLSIRFAQTNHLELPRVRAALEEEPTPEQMDALRHALDADYDVVRGVLAHTACFDPDPGGAEIRMLMLNYGAVGMAFVVLRRLGRPAEARGALGEMTGVVAHLANAAAQRAVVRSGTRLMQ